MGLPQSLPLRSEQELQSVASTLQQKEEISTKLAKKTKKTTRTYLKCKSLDTKDGKHDIGKDGAYPEDLGSTKIL